MPKEISINFSYVKHEFLVRFFEDGKLKNWETLTDSKDVRQAISEFYFPDSTPTPQGDVNG